MLDCELPAAGIKQKAQGKACWSPSCTIYSPRFRQGASGRCATEHSILARYPRQAARGSPELLHSLDRQWIKSLVQHNHRCRNQPHLSNGSWRVRQSTCHRINPRQVIQNTIRSTYPRRSQRAQFRCCTHFKYRRWGILWSEESDGLLAGALLSSIDHIKRRQDGWLHRWHTTFAIFLRRAQKWHPTKFFLQ